MNPDLHFMIAGVVPYGFIKLIVGLIFPVGCVFDLLL